MGKDSLAVSMDVPQAQRERLAFLELRAFFAGELRRGDIEARFGVKPAAASRDLSSYRDIAPANLDYDVAGRCYRPSDSFSPVFPFSTERVLAWLLLGFGDGLDLKLRQAAPCEGPGQLIKPNLDVLATITRALVAKKAVRVNYLSLSSGETCRDLVPVALADNGFRWHIRAFDRDKARFGDFVLTRLTKAQMIESEVQEHELLSADEQWARIVDLELVPHPSISWPSAVEADYGMLEGVLRIKARAALVGYVLRRWSVDSSPGHRLDHASHHLWLRNPQTLYGVESATLAPGYFDAGETAADEQAAQGRTE
ncbi:WYL domain-containing protein [Roseateles koreensis]|uniref:WYL domain-containing protein n=1 Tax=Roseateles koreensis TaxID=2987526 RepID=A0ABT5KVZ9_9BURK|nr:WYL domain-containing protein [Roseateles koreensis]MDC8787114.1 WYL domain-containing protein [Roseateles koreensis]